jgi:hypothetical protein
MVVVTEKDISSLCDTAAKAQDRVIELEKVLRSIASLWPLETCAKIGSVVGVNDGRSRAIIAESAINSARRVLNLPLA